MREAQESGNAPRASGRLPGQRYVDSWHSKAQQTRSDGTVAASEEVTEFSSTVLTLGCHCTQFTSVKCAFSFFTSSSTTDSESEGAFPACTRRPYISAQGGVIETSMQTSCEGETHANDSNTDM